MTTRSQANKTRNPENYKLKIYSAHTQHRQGEDLREKILCQISQTVQLMSINLREQLQRLNDNIGVIVEQSEGRI